MYSIIKRSFDIFFSFIALFLLLPLFLPIMIMLILTGEGDIFYIQERVGYKNKTFGVLKFATMLKDSTNIGSGMVTVRNDPRITPIGTLLRRSKLNEIPQIWNVLVGDMSLVGPRPLPKTSVAKYNSDIKVILYQNRPGITGIGSLIFRDEEKLVSAFAKTGRDPLEYYREHIYPYKGQLENWYYNNISFSTDVKILFLTFWSLFYAHSNLAFSVFMNIPKKSETLQLDWIINLENIDTAS